MKVMTKEYVEIFESTKFKEQDLIERSPQDLNNSLKIATFSDDQIESFNIYFLIKILREETGAFKDQTENLEGLQRSAYEFFKFNAGQIQIVFRDKTLQNVNFVIQPACRNLEESFKNEIQINLNRNTPKEKLDDFFGQKTNIFDMIEHSTNMFINKNIFSPSLQMYNIIRNVFLTLVTIMNLLILVFFQKKLSYGTSIDDPYFDSNHWILRVIAWVLVGI